MSCANVYITRRSILIAFLRLQSLHRLPIFTISLQCIKSYPKKLKSTHRTPLTPRASSHHKAIVDDISRRLWKLAGVPFRFNVFASHDQPVMNVSGKKCRCVQLLPQRKQWGKTYKLLCKAKFQQLTCQQVSRNNSRTLCLHRWISRTNSEEAPIKRKTANDWSKACVKNSINQGICPPKKYGLLSAPSDFLAK